MLTFHFLLAVLNGFPPKQVIADDGEKASNYFRSGDTITVRSSTSGSTQKQQSSSAPAPARAPAVPASGTTTTGGSSGNNATTSDSIAAHGEFVMREVPDDNSCLFRAVNGLLGSSQRSPAPLREIVANAVRANPITYNEAFLGRSNASYCEWILGSNAWGGAIELGILARRHRIEIGAFDLKTMRMDRYGEGEGFDTIGYLIYDGIHYNYLALRLAVGADVTQFEPSDALAMQKARDVCMIAHQAQRYTDTQNFRIMCDICGIRLKGEKEVVEHANSTGHGKFSEAK